MTAVRTREDLAGAPPVVHALIQFLERNEAPEGLFTEDVFVDFTMPIWRLQAVGPAANEALRKRGHPMPSTVVRARYDATPSGFVLEVEEEWDDANDHWYCRELLRADVRGDAISQISVYCTGDWNAAQVARHKAEVQLIRP
jgi:hypothetical protein